MSCRRVVLILGIAALASTVAPAFAAGMPCDPAYVTVRARTVFVQPTGSLDTANLQCAFDLAAAMGPGVVVQLGAGTFKTEQLVIQGLRGTVRGAGQQATLVRNPDYALHIDYPDCNGGGPCFADAAPSSTNRHPSLVSIMGQDVVLSHLTLAVTGHYGCEPWGMWGFEGIGALSNVVQHLGSNSTVRIERVTMDAGDFLIDETGIGGDALGPLIMWTFSRPWYVINSKMTAKESIMRGYNGVLAYNLERSSATILATRLEVRGIALAFSDLLASTIHAAHNEIVPLGPGVASIVMWSGNIGTGIVDSTLLIDNNVFGGDIGVLSDPGTFRNVDCRLVNNDITGVGVPYLFSEGSECLTVGSFELKH